jgi:hypothetical protein
MSYGSLRFLSRRTLTEARMRYIIVVASNARTDTRCQRADDQGNMGVKGGMSNMPTRATMPPADHMAGQSGAENCGTLDEPKSCPPLPRHPLPY